MIANDVPPQRAARGCDGLCLASVKLLGGICRHCARYRADMLTYLCGAAVKSGRTCGAGLSGIPIVISRPCPNRKGLVIVHLAAMGATFPTTPMLLAVQMLVTRMKLAWSFFKDRHGNDSFFPCFKMTYHILQQLLPR